MAAVKEELGGPFFPSIPTSKDGNPRKAVILDFSSVLSLWAQYAQDDHAFNEWGTRAESYSIDGEPGDATCTIFFDKPKYPPGDSYPRRWLHRDCTVFHYCGTE